MRGSQGVPPMHVRTRPILMWRVLIYLLHVPTDRRIPAQCCCFSWQLTWAGEPCLPAKPQLPGEVPRAWGGARAHGFPEALGGALVPIGSLGPLQPSEPMVSEKPTGSPEPMVAQGQRVAMTHGIGMVLRQDMLSWGRDSYAQSTRGCLHFPWFLPDACFPILLHPSPTCIGWCLRPIGRRASPHAPLGGPAFPGHWPLGRHACSAVAVNQSSSAARRRVGPLSRLRRSPRISPDAVERYAWLRAVEERAPSHGGHARPHERHGGAPE